MRQEAVSAVSAYDQMDQCRSIMPFVSCAARDRAAEMLASRLCLQPLTRPYPLLHTSSISPSLQLLRRPMSRLCKMQIPLSYSATRNIPINQKYHTSALTCSWTGEHRGYGLFKCSVATARAFPSVLGRVLGIGRSEGVAWSRGFRRPVLVQHHW